MRILTVVSSSKDQRQLTDRLRQSGHDVDSARSLAIAGRRAIGSRPDITLVDHAHWQTAICSGAPPAETARELNALGTVVVLDRQPTVESAVRAMRSGAADYRGWPGDQRSWQTLLKQLPVTGSAPQASETRADADDLSLSIIGSSDAMRQVRRMVTIAAKTDANVLIYGETGTGKDLVAQSIHRHSFRRAGPFVKVGCTLLPSSLIESELYGHEEGSFTGAERHRQGRFELADGGTIYLDDVDDVTIDHQGKLLRVIEEKVFERVGGSQSHQANVRVVASTKQDLLAKVAEGEFRQDLYYRLDVLRIRIPPLRQRSADIPELVNYVMQRAAGGRSADLTPDVMRILATHTWPGNVRELIHVLERGRLNCDGQLRTEWLQADLQDPANGSAASGSSLGARGGMPFREAIDQAERQLLAGALAAHRGNKTAAARSLGMKASTFRDKLARHGLVGTAGSH